MRLKSLAVCLVSASLLVGCQASKQNVGAMSGSVIGGILGSNVGEGSGRTAAIIGATMLGAYVGSSIGESLDRADYMYMGRAQQRAYSAPVGETISWNNPQSGHAGTITPTREGMGSNTGNYCREFQQTVTIGGQSEQAYGRACQQPDGSWKIVK